MGMISIMGPGIRSLLVRRSNPAHTDGRPLQKLFDAKTMKTISGQVIKIDRVPESAFGIQMRVTVFTDTKESLPVYLGPAVYVAGPG